MNSIPRFATRIAKPFGKRFLATVPKHSGVPEMYQNYSFRKAFMSDPSTYPMLIILSFTGTLVVGAFVHEIATDKDLKLNPKIKHQIIRDYGREHKPLFVSKLADPSYLPPEGLGVDHDEWVKAKEKREAK